MRDEKGRFVKGYKPAGGQDHHLWKGEEAGYWAIHKWLVKTFGKADHCEECGLNSIGRRYEWANLSGKYNRDRIDFRMLCVPCHRKFDGTDKLYLYSSRYQKGLDYVVE